MHDNLKFSCIKFSWHDFFMHETSHAIYKLTLFKTSSCSEVAAVSVIKLVITLTLARWSAAGSLFTR